MRAPFQINPAQIRQAFQLEPPVPPHDALRRSGAHYETKAYIATTLDKIATPHVGAATKIMVVGNDLPSVADPKYIWAHDLPKEKGVLLEWLRKGAELRYFAVAPTDAAVARLREVAKEFAPGQLQLRKLSAAAANDPRAARLAQLWKKSHFTVFENEPQLWVECYHPPEELEAQDCFYFSPELAASSPLYAQYSEEFEWMFAQFGEPVI